MRVLLLSDIHANLTALDAVLAASPPYDEIWNLGDTVGYGPRPRECLDRLAGLRPGQTLAGNHDLAAIAAIPLTAFNSAAQTATRWTAEQLSPTHRSFLGGLAASAEVDGITLAHGSPRSPIWEYITDATGALATFRQCASRLCFVGHSHMALRAALLDGDVVFGPNLLRHQEIVDLSAHRWIVNPGSVGQPRDRDPRAAYAVLDTATATLTALRVAYDIRETQRQMAEVRLPSSLSARLGHGV